MTLSEIAKRQGCSLAMAHYRCRAGTPNDAMFSAVMRASLRYRRWLFNVAPDDYRQTVWVAVVAASSYQSSGVNRDRMRLAMRLANSLLDELAGDLGFHRSIGEEGKRRWTSESDSLDSGGLPVLFAGRKPSCICGTCKKCKRRAQQRARRKQ